MRDDPARKGMSAVHVAQRMRAGELGIVGVLTGANRIVFRVVLGVIAVQIFVVVIAVAEPCLARKF